MLKRGRPSRRGERASLRFQWKDRAASNDVIDRHRKNMPVCFAKLFSISRLRPRIPATARDVLPKFD